MRKHSGPANRNLFLQIAGPLAAGLMTVGAALAMPVAAQVTAQPAAKFATPRQAIAMATVSNPRLSPDGRRVVYEQTRTDWQGNVFATDLWLADSLGNARQRLTQGSGSAGDAAWSPDGRWIAFLAERPGVSAGAPAAAGSGPVTGPASRQLLLIPASGGEAVVITNMAGGISSFEWAPDGNSIAFLAAGERPARLRDRDKALGSYRIIRSDRVPVRLWLIGVDMVLAGNTGPLPKARALTADDGRSVTALDFAPDSASIAFAAQLDPDPVSSGTSEIFRVAVGGGPIRQITDGRGPHGSPRFSPDGRSIAFATSAGAANYFFANRLIARISADGGPIEILTRSFDEDAQLLDWQADGIKFAARARTQSGLWRIDPTSGAIGRVDAGDSSIAGGFSFSADGQAAAFVGSAANQVPEVIVASGGLHRRITDMAAQWQGLTPARRELVSWSATDGARIEGVLYKPADFDPGRRYPLLVVIHGGPTGIDVPDIRPDRYYPVEQFVARGALVLRPNYRGSAGYGAKFRALNYRNLGVGDYADVIGGVDMLLRQGHIDAGKVGAMGWSQGGYISAFITTNSTRFKAVSVGAGISDWMTYYANTDITNFTRQYLGATPWRDPQIYARTSPISNVTKAQTPTLIQHGSDDPRVPIANAYELRLALEDQGVPVKMVVYDGFGHAINKPRQALAVLAENQAWFGQYIFGDKPISDLNPADDGLKLETPADPK
ncbi:S9 family peptidase [Sandarakinorhabdus sp.]|uniref:S9 family peptidase n=1 Tax=Sandarakinorhabdus sp. TaxID=1916663 RepID=UPI003341AEDF